MCDLFPAYVGNTKLWVLEKILSQVLIEQDRQKLGKFMGDETYQPLEAETVNTAKKSVREIRTLTKRCGRDNTSGQEKLTCYKDDLRGGQ